MKSKGRGPLKEGARKGQGMQNGRKDDGESGGNFIPNDSGRSGYEEDTIGEETRKITYEDGERREKHLGSQPQTKSLA